MISNIHIKNYKSITDLKIELGRVNVFIGENGAGKSNILEAIALAGAAAARKLDNEFLASRGIRVVRAVDMRPAFPGRSPVSAISVLARSEAGGCIDLSIYNDNKPYSKWHSSESLARNPSGEEFVAAFKRWVKSFEKNNAVQSSSSTRNKRKSGDDDGSQLAKRFFETFFYKISESVKNGAEKDGGVEKYSIELDELPFPMIDALSNSEDLAVRDVLSNFVAYSPENSCLRASNSEAQIEPLGIKGEGVSKLFAFYVNQAANADGELDEEVQNHAKSVLDSLDKSLRMLGWFDGLRLAAEKQEDVLELLDVYIEEEDRYFEFGSANEGFFLLLFYFLLFSSRLTPKFFAVDNIDASLNPALCRVLATELVELAKKNDKQVILTTHNPAILDGLNLDDEEQRLFVIRRSMNGESIIERVFKPKSFENLPNLKMSEAFIRGLIGGLPKTF